MQFFKPVPPATVATVVTVVNSPPVPTVTVASVATVTTPPALENSIPRDAGPPEGTATVIPLPLANPAPGDSAAATLAELGYKVAYLREPEPAQRSVADILRAGHRWVGLDLETMPKPAYATRLKAGLDPLLADIRLLQLATPDNRVFVFDLLRLPTDLLAPLMTQSWTAHNASFEWRFLKAAGLNPGNPHCTALMSRVATGVTLSLANASKQALGLAIDKMLQTSQWQEPELSVDQINYAALDAVLTLKLAQHYVAVVKQTGQAEAYGIFKDALPVVGQQMLDGVPFDGEGHRRQMADWLAELKPLQGELHQRLGGFNLDSAKQLSDWLRQHLDRSVLAAWPTTTTGQLKTDVATFQQAPDLRLLTPLRRYKLLRKRLSTYGDGYAKHIHPVTGRIHADFQIAGCRSGRFRCFGPNLQNAPRDSAFRSLFRAPDGYRLVVADYNQVELRIAALIANDKAMLDAYANGQDLHTKTAAAIADIPVEHVTKAERQLAKACNFGLLYGLGASGLAAYASRSYGISMTLEQAKAAKEAFFKAYPDIKRWHARSQVKGKITPIVRTQSGLLRDFSKEPTGFVLTESLNHPVQGTGAEVLLRALALLPHHLTGLEARLVHHIHDEIVIEVAERDVTAAKQALTAAMEEGFLAVFPDAPTTDLIEARNGFDWAAAK